MKLRLTDLTGQVTLAELEVETMPTQQFVVWQGRPFFRIWREDEMTYAECSSYWSVVERPVSDAPTEVGTIIDGVFKVLGVILKIAEVVAG